MTVSVCIDRASTIDSPDDDSFHSWITAALRRCDREGHVDIKIVDSDEMQTLNQIYRQQNKPTNVLSFPVDLPDDVESDLLGDIALCGPVIESEAHLQNKPISHHWAHMTIHGCLHLLGYDHINESDAVTMESLETSLLQSLHIPNPYLEISQETTQS